MLSRFGLLLGFSCVAFLASGCGPSGPSENTGQSAEALDACPPGTTVLGIDIASYQHPGGAGIDWPTVAANRRFAIVKASEGNGYTNDYYADDSAQARANGMYVGAYHFLRYTSSGAEQAQHFLASVGGSVAPSDLPPMLDVEEVNDAASPDQRVQIMKEWLDTVEAAIGRKPMIYSGSWYWGPYMGSPGGYAGVYPMVWAAYTGGSCPKVPDDFPGLTMWQYLGGDGSTPGIAAPCDQDMFYGSESDLAALVDRPPQGWLDAAGCDQISGWAQDPDAPTTAIDVHVYAGGPAGSGAPGVPIHADIHRDDLCGAIGSCEHGYSLAPPLSLFDGQPHEIHAYGIDQGGSNNAELSGSPQNLNCAPTPPSGVRRHVTDPTSFAAWKFDEFWDTLPLGDAEIQKLPASVDLVAAPELWIADDGTPEVWLVDGNYRRHVPDPAAMNAWRFDWGAIATKPAADVYAKIQGPEWRHRPVLLHDSSGAIWVVDDSLSTETGTGGTGGSGGATGSGGSSAGGSGIGGTKAKGTGGSSLERSKDLTDPATGCSCRLQAEGRQMPLAPWASALGLGLILVRARRRRGSGSS